MSGAGPPAQRQARPLAAREFSLHTNPAPRPPPRQWPEREKRARRYGSAIAIGHPHRQTLRALEGWVGAAQARGFDIVPVSTIIATRGSALWRLARDRRGGAGS